MVSGDLTLCCLFIELTSSKCESTKRLIQYISSIADDMAPPEDIEKIARAVLDIQMPQSPDQIRSMIDEINNLLSNVTNYQDNLKDLKEQAKNAQELLEKAQEVKYVSRLSKPSSLLPVV